MEMAQMTDNSFMDHNRAFNMFEGDHMAMVAFSGSDEDAEMPRMIETSKS